ncbi:MAG: methylmalonyl-CoA mutase family protein [Chitinophagales bacterium]
MADSILQQISSQFKSISAEDWKNKIIKDLKGEQFEKLISQTTDEIEILPFYTEETTKDFRLKIPEKQTANWSITEKIVVENIVKANADSLHALQNGANCILFDLHKQPLSTDDINQLTDGILIDVAPVYFYNYVNNNKTDLEKAVPNSCIDPVIVQQQDSAVNELTDALQQALKSSYSSSYFHFYIGQNYFLEIAKFRAFRWLWHQLAALNKIQDTVFIIAETGNSNRVASEKEIYNNMLRNTTEAMSAVLGGCDYLIINSHDVAAENSDFGKRIARNVQHILQQESYFSDMPDLAKGSYYIEYLTYQLANKTWKKLQCI